VPIFLFSFEFWIYNIDPVNDTANFARPKSVIKQLIQKSNSDFFVLGFHAEPKRPKSRELCSQSYDFWIYNYNASVVVRYSIFKVGKIYFYSKNALYYSLHCKFLQRWRCKENIFYSKNGLCYSCRKFLQRWRFYGKYTYNCYSLLCNFLQNSCCVEKKISENALCYSLRCNFLQRWRCNLKMLKARALKRSKVIHSFFYSFPKTFCMKYS
jgi:hypothetical protein